MRYAAIGLMGLFLAQGTQDAPNRSPLVLEIAARGYLQGGRASSLAGDSAPDRLESYVWADQSLCGMGAGDQAPANTPWTGWHFTGNVVSRGSDELVVEVRWQRMWEGGRRVTNTQPETRTFRIRSGEKVELDRIAPSNQGACGTLEARLEAGVAARAAYLMGVPGGVATGVRGGRGGGVATGVAGAGGSRGVRGGAAGGGVATGVAGGVASGARGGVASAGVTGDPTGVTTAQGAAAAGVQGGRGGRGQGGGGGRAVAGVQGGGGGRGTGGGGASAGSGSGVTGATSAASAVVRGGRGSGEGGSTTAGTYSAFGGRGGQANASAQFEAEVWLVHKKPDGTEHVQQQTLRFGAAGFPFTFPPVQVPGSGGAITIDISGSVQTLNSTGQRYGLTQGYVGRGSVTQGYGGRATLTPVPESATPLFGISIARRARRATPFIDTRGATDISLQTPKPDDVLSFELPALQKSTEDLLKGHTFSLRLRVSPIK